jgi:phosphate uptake regulator
MRKTFETEIQQLKDELLLLGSMVEQQILDSVEALKKRDVDASRRIRELDDQVNAKRYAIEEQVMIVIATQQSMAHDLRLWRPSSRSAANWSAWAITPRVSPPSASAWATSRCLNR